MKVKFGAIVTEGRGKLGGHVFTRNPYADVMRTKVSPCQPSSSFQQVVKARLTAAAQAWRGFSDPVRKGFESLAQNVSRTNIFGDSAKLSGFALFVRLQRELSEIGVAVLTAAPAMPTMEAVTALALASVAATPTWALTGSASGTPTAFTLVVQATVQVSKGVAFVGSKFRTLAHQTGNAAITYDGHLTYPARFGTIVAGNRIYARAKLVHTATGFSSGWVSCSGDAT